MFPPVKIRVSGLEQQTKYIVAMDTVSVDSSRYKFSNWQWVIAGKTDCGLGRPLSGVYIHPDSPSTGEHWMKQTISFHKLKLTNNVDDKNGYVSVTNAQYLSVQYSILKDHLTRTFDLHYASTNLEQNIAF